MEISAGQVKELRDRTGAGMLACKSALQEAEGRLEEAVVILRKQGLAAAAKKVGRATAEGAVGSYIHAGGRIGVLVEVNCETDFVAKTDEFQVLVRDVAMHVAASSPLFVSRQNVDTETLAREERIAREQAQATGKPQKVLEKIVAGKLERFYQEVCLLEQPFVKDPDRSVQEIIHAAVAKTGENIQIRRFIRFGLGESLDSVPAQGTRPPGVSAG
ncbi:MAG: translation elongation factor Ts [Acidobacteriota bacterium]